jgi:hypothetical protein
MFFLICLTVLALMDSARADVPQMIHYQGRALVGSTNFHGTGQFKFALVDDGSLVSAQATVTAVLFNGFMVGINVTTGGAGYSTPPSVTITDSTGLGATASATVSNGVVIKVTVNNAGSGYSSPVVTIAPASSNLNFTSFWSNDGTSAGGAEPSGYVSLNVNKGVYSVLLGNNTLSNMVSIPVTVFTNSDVRLRIWFNDGLNGFQLLSPDQRISAVGYAMIASTVEDQAITNSKLADASVTASKLASNAVTGASIAQGSITGLQIASGAIGSNNLGIGSINAGHLASGAVISSLQASGLAPLPSGSIVFSESSNALPLLNLGFVQIGSFEFGAKEWRILDPVLPRLSVYASAVWTGNDVLIWNGPTNNIIRYNPYSNSVSLIPTLDPPSQAGGISFWTGNEMLVWGIPSGSGPNASLIGFKYNPASNRWFTIPSMTTTGYNPATGFSIVWSGSELLIWGGQNYFGTSLNFGAKFNAASNSWSAISASSPIGLRYGHAALWAGTEMVIWGGREANGSTTNTGARYNPTSNSWQPMNNNTVPRMSPSALWTGTEILLFGDTDGVNPDTIGRYNPQNDSWSSSKSAGNDFYWAAWVGNEAFLYSAMAGFRFNPVTGSWKTCESSTPLYYGGSARPLGLGSEILFLGDGSSTPPAIYRPVSRQIKYAYIKL